MITDLFVTYGHGKLLFMNIALILLCPAIFYKIIEYSQKLNKFSITAPNVSVDIEVKDDFDNNLINNNYDFIRKIISICNIKYLIFEDIDRFDKPEVFEHLRELNKVLNSKKANFFRHKEVKFVYLLKDDIFKNENRTKFFDFIYPVVPYVSYGEAGTELYKLFINHNLDKKGLDKDFAYDIGLYIQDMRILKNTINEFEVYSIELNKEIKNSKELFSTLLYKNLFSEDFSLLQKDDGELYNYIEFLKEKREKEIKLYEADNKRQYEIIKANDNIIGNKNYVKENVVLAIIQYLARKIGDYYYNQKIEIQNEKIIKENIVYTNYNRLASSINNCDVKVLLNGNTIIKYYNGSHNNITIKDLLIEMDKKDITDDLKKIDDYNYNLIQDKIYKNNKQIEILKNHDFNDDFRYFGYFEEMKKIHKNNKKYVGLLNYLFDNGYITDNYKYYISKLHQGTIFTDNDYEYLGYLRSNQKKINYKIKVDNPRLLIDKKINDRDLNSNGIINLDIVCELFYGKDDKIIENNIISKLLDYENTVDFLYDLSIAILKSRKRHLWQFYKIFIKNNSCWMSINNNLESSSIEKAIYIVERMIQVLDDNTIKEINDIDSFKEFLEDNYIYLKKKDYPEKEKLFKLLSVKYTDLNKIKNKENLTMCIKNNWYRTNYNNIEYIAKNNYIELNKEDYIINIKQGIIENILNINLLVLDKNIPLEIRQEIVISNEAWNNINKFDEDELIKFIQKLKSENLKLELIEYIGEDGAEIISPQDKLKMLYSKLKAENVSEKLNLILWNMKNYDRETIKDVIGGIFGFERLLENRKKTELDNNEEVLELIDKLKTDPFKFNIVFEIDERRKKLKIRGTKK